MKEFNEYLEMATAGRKLLSEKYYDDVFQDFAFDIPACGAPIKTFAKDIRKSG